MGRGFGEKKIKLLFEKFPYLISDRKKALKLSIDEIKVVEGVANITASQFIENLPKFYKFYDDLGIVCKNKNLPLLKNELFKDIKFVFTGFRNKDYEKIIEDNGGSISNSISKNTTYLVVKDLEDDSNKIKQAKELKIKIISKEELDKMLDI